MKSTAINTLQYTGTVTLSRYIGTKKIEITRISNRGAAPLFSFFADCLLGDFDMASLGRPTKIMLLSKQEITNDDGASESSYERRSGFLSLIKNPEKDLVNNTSIVRYSFMVSSDILEGTSFNSIGLYSKATDETEFKNFAAVVSVPSELRHKITSSSALVVDWELKISNKEGT